MDTVKSCLSLSPDRYLLTAFSTFNFIWSTIQQVQASKQQLCALGQSIAQLLLTLNNGYSSGRLKASKTSVPLMNLILFLNEVSGFVQKQAAYSFLELIFSKDERIVTIGDYHGRIGIAIDAFKISAILNVQNWDFMHEKARKEDQDALNDQLSSLERDHNRLKEALGAQKTNVMAIMASLQRHLDRCSSSQREHQFLRYSLRYLSTWSGSQVKIEDWMITSFEVDFGPVIGSGSFGQVHKGKWHKIEIAIKVLKSENGVTPSSEAILREIKTWSRIRHPHILQFLGANVLDEKPFIVIPYTKNGNVRDYIRNHPDCNRLQLLHHVSLGLVYLHSQNVIHGNLKGRNVLIDDSGKALLGDFGLSRVKADAASHTAAVGAAPIIESLNWTAPEQIMGGSPGKPCDIYAFGMTMFEICANEIPLGHLSYFDFIDLVVHRNVRPDQPDPDEAPGLSDEVWQLAEQCWAKEPSRRPNANVVCDSISHILVTRIGTAVVSSLPRQAQSWVNDLPQISPKIQHPSAELLQAQPIPLPVDTEPPHDQLNRPIINWAGLSPASRLIQHTTVILSIAFSPDGQKIVSGNQDATVQIWDVETGKPVSAPMKGHIGIICSVAFSPDGQTIASGARDKTIRMWRTTTATPVLRPFTGHSDLVRSVVFSPDGQWIASGSFDLTIRVWDVKTGRCVLDPFEGHTDGINSVAFSPDGKLIASGSSDRTIRVWDAKTGSCLYGPLEGHTGWARAVAFSLDGHWIASGSGDKTVRLWSVETGKCASEPFQGHTNSVASVAFSPDGRYIASGSSDNTVRVWDVKTGLCISGPFQEHTRWVLSVGFSPDGQSIASGSYDRSIRIWSCN